MSRVADYPLLVFALSLVAMAAAAWLGALVGKKSALDAQAQSTFGVVESATLTLLGLIIAFTFSMAVNRYDQRKNLEEAEANAIGTEYVRADLLPAADAAKVRLLLRSYLERRVAFYVARDAQELQRIAVDTGRLQAELWAAVRSPALTQPTPVAALAVAGMNDALNAEGYTQAAWWNHIPPAAWILMLTIAICGNALVGYGNRRIHASATLLLVLPLLIATAFLLIADLDSPRGGVIRVVPQNLLHLAGSLGSSSATR